MNHYTHPQSVVAIALIRRLHAADGVQPIRAIGAFSVQLASGDDVVFTRRHFVYQPNDVLGPITDLHSLVNSRTDCLTNIGPDLRKLALLPDNDRLIQAERYALPIRDHHCHRLAHYISASDDALSAIGRLYDIALAPTDASEDIQAARAPQLAQAIWLAWLTGVLSKDPDNQTTLAAFQAWQMLESARIIPF